MLTVKFGRKSSFGKGGYTIVELMIVLAITVLLFGMIGMTIIRQQGRTQFQTAARDLESNIRDILNDTSSGYYARPTNFNCQAGSLGLVFTTGGTAQGSSQECIFLGRVIHFNPNGANSNSYNVYTVAGYRQVNEGGIMRNIENYVEARPQAVANSGGPGADITEVITMPGGVTLTRISDNTASPVHALGIFTRLGALSPDAEPGAADVDFIPLRSGGGATASKGAILTRIRAINDTTPARNPANGVLLCFRSGSTDQHAIMKVGGNSRDLSTDMEIREGQCPATLVF